MSEAAEQLAPEGTGQADVAPEQPATETPAQVADVATNWYDGQEFSDEDIGFIQNKGWDTPVKSLEAYKNLEKFHGVPAEQIVKLPSTEGEAGEWDAVYDKLGRPEDAEGYGEFAMPEGVEAPIDADRVKWAAAAFHKVGLNVDQRNMLMAMTAEYENGIMSETGKQTALQQETQLKELQQEWGAGFDERSELGRRAVRSFLPGEQGEKEALLEKIEGAVGTAVTLKLFANMGEKIGEDRIDNADGNRQFGYTPEQAKADIASLKLQLEGDSGRLSIYNQGKGPDYDNMQKLNKLAYSG
jgi:hypothetical protein